MYGKAITNHSTTGRWSATNSSVSESGTERIQVDDERCKHEWRCRQDPSARVPSGGGVRSRRPGTATRTDRGFSRTRSAMIGESGGEPSDLNHGCGGERRTRWLRPIRSRPGDSVLGRSAPVASTAGRCAHERTRARRVDLAHPLHGDEKRFVVGQPDRVELGDLIAKVVLELVDVVAVDGRRARRQRSATRRSGIRRSFMLTPRHGCSRALPPRPPTLRAG